jgi:hypothetical protein
MPSFPRKLIAREQSYQYSLYRIQQYRSLSFYDKKKPGMNSRHKDEFGGFAPLSY